MMAAEEEAEHSTLKLPLLSIPPLLESPVHPGMVTPPLYTLASVPFRWEEEPGKPTPSCTTTVNTEPKGLHPPPRLFTEPSKLRKTPSPNTVLDGPYYVSRRKFTSSSFRFFRERRRQVSFDSTGSRSPEKGQLSAVVLGKKKSTRKRLFPSWGQRDSSKNSGSSFVFPSTIDAASFGFDETSNDNMARIRRNGSLSSLSQAKPRFWAAVYEGLKQVVPWKSRK